MRVMQPFLPRPQFLQHEEPVAARAVGIGGVTILHLGARGPADAAAVEERVEVGAALGAEQLGGDFQELVFAMLLRSLMQVQCDWVGEEFLFALLGSSPMTFELALDLYILPRPYKNPLLDSNRFE